MIGESIAAKIIGVAAGSALALVFDPPRTRSGFFRRLVASVLAGGVFGHVVLAFAEWTDTWENIVAAWCLAAFCSWSGMTVLTRVVQAYKREEG
jgi:hypothetical protein